MAPPPGPSMVPVSFVPSCLKVAVRVMPPSGPPKSPDHLPVTSAAQAAAATTPARMAARIAIGILSIRISPFLNRSVFGRRLLQVVDNDRVERRLARFEL